MKRRTVLQMASLAPVAVTLPAQARELPPEGLKKGAGEATVEMVTTFEGGLVETHDFDSYVGWNITSEDGQTRWVGTTQEAWDRDCPKIDALGRHEIAENVMRTHAWTRSEAFKKASEAVFKQLERGSF